MCFEDMEICTNSVPILYQIYAKNVDIWIEIYGDRFCKSLNLGRWRDVERFVSTCILSPHDEVLERPSDFKRYSRVL